MTVSRWDNRKRENNKMFHSRVGLKKGISEQHTVLKANIEVGNKNFSSNVNVVQRPSIVSVRSNTNVFLPTVNY
jgi:hypothetical protein